MKSSPLLLLLLVFAFRTAAAPAPDANQNPASARPLAPLFNNLGKHHHAVTTQSKLAQRYFDQGLILLYGFNHTEAIRSFRAAAQADPNCAMAWWGVAAAYGPNINAPMEPSAVPKAWRALQTALSLTSKASPREQAYLEALTKRYQAQPPPDRSGLDQAYANAMRDMARQYPDDLDASVLFAEAIMDTMPWDYWTPDLEPKPATKELLATLESVLHRDPLHPGANHFYIHAVEAGPHPEAGIPSADRLGRFAPGAGHLVHMPSHIYVRVGDYDKASAANVQAVKADETYISHCKAQGFYPGVYYPHAVHFLWYARGWEGRSKDCIKTAKKVAEYALDGRCGVLEGPRLRHLPLLALAPIRSLGRNPESARTLRIQVRPGHVALRARPGLRRPQTSPGRRS
jgi:tetratricopeptide (TPR) repeat protein